MTAQVEKPTLLRIGIIIESFLQPRWVRKSLENVLATGLCTFALVVKVEPEEKSGGNFLYKLYDRVDRRLFRTDATELVNIEDVFSEVPVTDDVNKIAEFNLDLLINFAAPELNKKLANLVRHGVWFYSFGNAPGFNEVMHQLPITHSSLRSRKGETEQIIYHSASPTLSRFSVGLNNNTCYWKSAAFLARGLRDLHEGQNVVSNFNHREDSSQLPGTGTMGQMF